MAATVSREVWAVDVAASEQPLALARKEDAGELLEKSRAAEANSPAEATVLAQRALAAASTDLMRLKARARIATLDRRRGDYRGALTRASEGAAEAARLGATALQAEFLNVVGRAHWSLTEFPAALEAYQEQLRLADALGDRALQADAHTGLGIVQLDAGNLDAAHVHFESNRRLAEALNDVERRANASTELGLLEKARGNYAVAQSHLESAMRLNEQRGVPRGIADCLLNLGALATAAGDPRAALPRYEEALRTYQRLGLTRQQANVHRLTGAALRQIGDFEASSRHLEQARLLAEPLKSATVLARIFRELALTHEARGDFKAALTAERALAAQNEAALNDKTRERLAELQTRYDVERHAHENALLRRDQALQAAELRRAEVTRTAVAVVAGVVVLAAGGLIAAQRARLRARRRALLEMQAAKTAAEDAHALKSRLLRIASHDLKNPLGAILGGLECIQDEPSLTPELAVFTGELKGEGERMLQLIRDLLDHSALEMGRFKLVSRPLDLVVLVRRVVHVMESAARQKRQSITIFTPDAESIEIEGDEARLWQVVENLVSNALKFSPAGGVVEITLAEENGAATFAVRDQGPGIKAEEIGQLFLPFSKASALPTGGESSSGLGLSLVRELIELHGGRVWVDSSEGEGATFTFSIPERVSAGVTRPAREPVEAVH